MKEIRRELIVLLVCGTGIHTSPLFVSVSVSFKQKVKKKPPNLNDVPVLVCGTFYADGTDYHDDRVWLILKVISETVIPQFHSHLYVYLNCFKLHLYVCVHVTHMYHDTHV